MPLLNEPVGYDEREEDDWTPAKGIRRAAVAGGIAAALLMVLSAALAFWLPAFLILWYARMPLAFGLAFVLFCVVQHFAGMTGWPCTLIAVGYSAIVLLSHHVLLALADCSLEDSPHEPGAGWLRALTLWQMNVLPGIAVAACGALCHRFGADFSAVLEYLGLPIQGTSR